MQRRRRAWRAVTLAAVCCAIGSMGVSCPNNNNNNDNNSNNGPTVNVSEREFQITLDKSSVAAGKVTFHVKNDGVVGHTFLVIKTDLAPDQLPTEPNGTFDENNASAVVIDKIEMISPGESRDLSISDLTAGKYVLICNMFEAGLAHYQLGMRVGFTVR